MIYICKITINIPTGHEILQNVELKCIIFHNHITLVQKFLF